MAAPRVDRKVWLVDSDPMEGKQFRRLLRRSRKLPVEYLEPLPTLDSYNAMASAPETGALLIDSSLGENLPYDAIALATYMRTLRSELPIFALTDAFDEVIQKGGPLFDSIIEKVHLRKYYEAYVARILRSVKRYDEALSEKQSRMRELIDRDISGQITSGESIELEALQSELSRPADLSLARQSSRIQDQIKQQDEILDTLDQIHQKLNSM